MKKIFSLLAVTMLAWGMVLSNSAHAQAYPTKPIRLVVPFPPGGPSDLLARVIGEKLATQIGQPVIVDNKPGANTVIAAEFVARAPADGYTLLMAIDSTIVMNPYLYSKLRYDPFKDFSPIALVATIPGVILVNNATPANSLQEFIALAKSKPGEISFGGGTIFSQLAGELINSMAGIKMNYVAYKGGATTVTALVGGEIPMIIDGPTTALSFWKAGKVKALAVTSAKRLSQAPSIPTVAESGLAGYDVASWLSIFAPVGTARPIIDRLNLEIVRIMKMPDTRERLAASGIEPAFSTPEELEVFARKESVKWGKVIRDNSIKID
jgi:tripartite-type tricarboxylate transporter receptor subunit TctC